jgi:hypothetical protein
MDAISFEKLKIENRGLQQRREECARELLQAKRRKFSLQQARSWAASPGLHSVTRSL